MQEVRTPGYSPMDVRVVHIVDHNGQTDESNSHQRSDGGKVDHFAQMTTTIGEIGGVTRCLSNLYPECYRESGVTMRRVPSLT